MQEVISTASEAVCDIDDGVSVAVGGFGRCPELLIRALYEKSSTRLSIVSSNCGIDAIGLALLAGAGRVARTLGSHRGIAATSPPQHGTHSP
jgi:3-oxoacid CoA-transferase subunit A